MSFPLPARTRIKSSKFIHGEVLACSSLSPRRRVNKNPPKNVELAGKMNPSGHCLHPAKNERIRAMSEMNLKAEVLLRLEGSEELHAIGTIDVPLNLTLAIIPSQGRNPITVC